MGERVRQSTECIRKAAEACRGKEGEPQKVKDLLEGGWRAGGLFGGDYVVGGFVLGDFSNMCFGFTCDPWRTGEWDPISTEE